MWLGEGTSATSELLESISSATRVELVHRPPIPTEHWSMPCCFWLIIDLMISSRFGLRDVRPGWPINLRAINTVSLHSRGRVWFDFAFDTVQQGETPISLFSWRCTALCNEWKCNSHMARRRVIGAMGNMRISCKPMLAILVVSFIVFSGATFAEPEIPNEGFGEWKIETLKDGRLVGFEYEQWIPQSDNAVDTATFGFLCYKRSGSIKIDAVVNPFKGYNNQQDELFVLIKGTSSEKYTLGQKWKNGYTYIVLN